MKMKDNKGFTLIELLIVVAIIGIIAAIAVPGLLRARQSGNEASAIGSMRAINNAQATFAGSCAGGGYAQSLEDLALAPANGVPFISPDLNADAVQKSGYVFAIDAGTDVTVVTAAGAACNANAEDAIATFFAHTEPITAGSTGQRSFATDQRGTIYFKSDGTAVAADMSDGTVLQ